VTKGPEDSDAKERERKLDQAIEMTFPASDPIAVGHPIGTEALFQPVSTPQGEVRAFARVVTVFGGTGFLGRRIVGHLRAKGFTVRIASRHQKPQKGDDPQLLSVATDIHDASSIAMAIAGAFGLVNAVSLYVERGKETFHAVHVAVAERLANEARKAGVERLVQISGIGADAKSASPYIRARGQGEEAVKAVFRQASIVRPAVMFGIDDAFLNTLIKLLRRLPVYPMFGSGRTRLQPADVEDVGEAVARLLERTEPGGLTVECGGPRIYSYEELLRTIARGANVRPILIPMPFALWHALGWAGEFVPGAPVTRNQVELMEIDTVASPEMPGFATLGIDPQPMEQVLERMLRAS
jgi:NADH dehydrogenase